MQRNGERLGLMLLAPGVVIGLLGVYLSVYTVCPSTLAACTHPYEAGGPPLEILGLVLGATGALMWSASFLRRRRARAAQVSVDPSRLVVVPIGPARGSVFDGGVVTGMEAAVNRRAEAAAACTRCGATLPENASFCSNCGSPIER